MEAHSVRAGEKHGMLILAGKHIARGLIVLAAIFELGACVVAETGFAIAWRKTLKARAVCRGLTKLPLVHDAAAHGTAVARDQTGNGTRNAVHHSLQGAKDEVRGEDWV